MVRVGVIAKEDMSNNAQHVYFLQKKKAEILARKSREKAGFEPSALLKFANDGSFLERFNKMMQQREQKQQLGLGSSKQIQRKEQQKSTAKPPHTQCSSSSPSIKKFKLLPIKKTEPELNLPAHIFIKQEEEDEEDDSRPSKYDLAKKLAQKVAAEGDEIENKMKIEYRGDSRYQFLFYPSSSVAQYYQSKLKQYKENTKCHSTTNGDSNHISGTKKRKRKDDTSARTTSSDKTRTNNDDSKKPVPCKIQRFSADELAKLIQFNKAEPYCNNEKSKYENDKSKKEKCRENKKKKSMRDEPSLSSLSKIEITKEQSKGETTSTMCPSKVEIKKKKNTDANGEVLFTDTELATLQAKDFCQDILNKMKTENKCSKQARKRARRRVRKRNERRQAKREMFDSEKKTRGYESPPAKRLTVVEKTNSKENVNYKATIDVPQTTDPLDEESLPVSEASNGTIELTSSCVNENSDELLNNIDRNSKHIEHQGKKNNDGSPSLLESISTVNDLSSDTCVTTKPHKQINHPMCSISDNDNEPMYTVDENSECCEFALLELIPQIRDTGKGGVDTSTSILELAGEKDLVYSVYSRTYRSRRREDKNVEGDT